MRGVPNQCRLISRATERLRRHVRRIRLDEQLPGRGECCSFTELVVTLERHIARKRQHVAAINRLTRDVDRRRETMQHDMLRLWRIRENAHHVSVTFAVVNHECLTRIDGQLDVPAECLFLHVQWRGPVRIMLDPIGVNAGLSDGHAALISRHLCQTLTRSLIQLTRTRRVNRARRKDSVIEVCGLQSKLRLVETIADRADALNAGIDSAFNNRIHLIFGAGAGGGEVRVGVDKPSNSLGGNRRGARFLLRHEFQPILEHMTFHDIDAATRTQIDRDLAEAAVAGINGSVRDIVASFEETLSDYLSLDPDLRRTYSRGDVARMYGTALGDAFIREHGFEWQLLIDAYGTDLVVTSPDREMYTAPLVVVDTRFEDEETGKLTTFIEQFLGD